MWSREAPGVRAPGSSSGTDRRWSMSGMGRPRMGGGMAVASAVAVAVPVGRDRLAVGRERVGAVDGLTVVDVRRRGAVVVGTAVLGLVDLIPLGPAPTVADPLDHVVEHRGQEDAEQGDAQHPAE